MATSITYDNLGRATQEDHYDSLGGLNTTITTSYLAQNITDPAQGNSAVRQIIKTTRTNSGGNAGGTYTQTFNEAISNSQGQVFESRQAAATVASTPAADATNVITLRQAYDPFGNIICVTPDADGVSAGTNPRCEARTGVQIKTSYDLRGRKTSMTDPNTGTWNYSYNGAGELLIQTDAKNQATVTTYDNLGRVIQRQITDSGGTIRHDTKTAYDCANGRGMACTAVAITYQGSSSTGAGNSNSSISNPPLPTNNGTASNAATCPTASLKLGVSCIASATKYDNQGRAFLSTTTIKTASNGNKTKVFNNVSLYDSDSRLSYVGYPADDMGNNGQTGTRNEYTGNGYIKAVTDAHNQEAIHWQVVLNIVGRCA